MVEGDVEHKVKLDTPELRAAFLERVASLRRSDVYRDWDSLMAGEERMVTVALTEQKADHAFLAGQLKGIQNARSVLNTWALIVKKQLESTRKEK